jgi:hypothetical protein
MCPAYHDGVVDGKANVRRGTKPSAVALAAVVAVGAGAQLELASSPKTALDDTNRNPTSRLDAGGTSEPTTSLDNDPAGRAVRSIDRSILPMVAVERSLNAASTSFFGRRLHTPVLPSPNPASLTHSPISLKNAAAKSRPQKSLSATPSRTRPRTMSKVYVSYSQCQTESTPLVRAQALLLGASFCCRRRCRSRSSTAASLM